MIAIGDLAYDDDGRGAPAEPTSTHECAPTEELLETARAIRERTDRAARLRALARPKNRACSGVDDAVARLLGFVARCNRARLWLQWAHGQTEELPRR